MEERVRFFIYDGVRQELPSAQFVSATPVTAGCRMIKSPAEIALMQQANDITLQAIGVVVQDAEGRHDDAGAFGANVAAATRKLGGNADGALVIFGKYTAFPHGSIQPQKLHDGDVVLIDAGCTVDGYTSDITRTTVFGKPTQRMRDVWDVEKRAQSAALAAAQIGATCESVDAAARKVITDGGIRSGLQDAGTSTSHRATALGSTATSGRTSSAATRRRLQPGMCFSDEPTIVIYGEFGIRLEDCLHITRRGPKMFTPQSPSIEHPV